MSAQGEGCTRRREKSLGELCKRFVRLYAHETNCVVELNWTTARLGMERRRIYDIINILESLEVVVRLGKNTYTWRGLGHIPETLEKMKGLKDVPPYRKDKSLGLLCLHFIHFFLHQSSIVTLREAAQAIAPSSDDQQVKTKVRRLYDISNVLMFLRLTEKTTMDGKAAYAWRGAEGFGDFMSAWTGCAAADEQVWAPNQLVSTPCFDRLMSDLVSCLRAYA